MLIRDPIITVKTHTHDCIQIGRRGRGGRRRTSVWKAFQVTFVQKKKKKITWSNNIAMATTVINVL